MAGQTRTGRGKAQALFRRGAGLHGAGRLGQAVAAYHAAVLLAPDHADALASLAAALTGLGRHAAAAAAWERVVRLCPAKADAAVGLGQALLADGRPDAALVQLSAACERLPADARLLRLNARALLALGLPDPAIGALHLALDLQPGEAGAHAELAMALFNAGQSEAALPHSLAALRLLPTPRHAAMPSCVLIDLGRHAEALAAADAGLLACPGRAEVLVNRSIALEGLGRHADALAAARAAVAAAPDAPAIRHHLAATLLASGALTAEAWALYEARHDLHGVRRWPAGMRRWDGGPLRGRTLLLHAEQGLGDTLQFVRYSPLAAARGGRVILAVQPALVRLLRGTPGIDQVVPAGADLPPFDVFAPLLSLPGLFGTTWGSVPPPLPYAVRRAAQATGQLRVGLAWAGGSGFVDDRKRSMAAAALGALGGIAGVRFFGLQMGAGAMPPGLAAQDLMHGVQDFADTAEQVAGLDLVIAVDTAVAHLAATMGVPTWLLSRFRGCWRWGHGRADSPWYPALRVFRQAQPGDWDGVVAKVRAALHALAATRGGAGR